MDARFDIQTVIRPHSDDWHDFRGYVVYKIVSGRFETTKKVSILPSGFETRIKDMRLYKDELTEVSVHLQV